MGEAYLAHATFANYLGLLSAGGEVGKELAYTRYCFVSGLLRTNQYYSLRTHPLFRYPTPPRHRPHYCAVVFAPDPPLLQYIPHNTGNGNIV